MYVFMSLCVLQISSTRSQCKHPQAWRRGGTLLIWVQARHPPLAHVFVPFNVSAPITKHAYVHIHRYTGAHMCVLPETESQRMWDLSLSCVHTKTVLQHYVFHFPNSLLSCAPTHSSFLSSPVSLWAPSLTLPLPALLLSLSLTHTLFPFQQPVPVQILSDFLSAAQHFSAAFFHCSPALIPLPAVFSLLQRGEPLSCIFQQKESTSFICM